MRLRSTLWAPLLLLLAILAVPALAASPPGDPDAPALLTTQDTHVVLPAAPVLEVVVSVSPAPASAPLRTLGAVPIGALDTALIPHLRSRPPSQGIRLRAELVPADGVVVAVRANRPPQRE